MLQVVLGLQTRSWELGLGLGYGLGFSSAHCAGSTSVLQWVPGAQDMVQGEGPGWEVLGQEMMSEAGVSQVVLACRDDIQDTN